MLKNIEIYDIIFVDCLDFFLEEIESLRAMQFFLRDKWLDTHINVIMKVT
ncbi:hypothetical protein HMPREF9999_01961 [Alloprevotella sp. oral taxon 473 str. F0040]|nr:hypothetical protein HMPREF9999_01961 [Alloprevotella sp. oral taxon 473 str. F0040]